jgi:hypothetical protein
VPWDLAHLLTLGLWGGIVLAEAVIEIVGQRDRTRAGTVALLHYHIDLWAEGPVLFAIILTGTVLAFQTPLSPLHWVKIACALFAVLVNVWCIGVVVRRHRRFDALSPDARARATSHVFLAVKLGLPAALAALYLGLRFSLGA